jgi:hypothetical protein
MAAGFSVNAVIAAPGQQFTLASLLAADGITQNGLPQYLVLNGLDRNEYTAASNGQRGSLSGNGQIATFHAANATIDSSTLSIVFTYTPQGYVNTTYGYLNALTFTSSTDQYRNEVLSLYGFGKAGSADPAQLARLYAMASDPYDNATPFLTAAADNFLGALDIVTRSGLVDPTPNAATAAEVAAQAQAMVGRVWNDNGCWTLASNIAAAAGATLPPTTNTTPDWVKPQANGEWIVAYNSTTASAAEQLTWQAQLRPGDMVLCKMPCFSHIATVVSGYGYGALTVDNTGAAANDGAPDDIVIAAAAAEQTTFFGADPRIVVIYRLAAPVITALAPMAIAASAMQGVAPLFTTEDPGGRAIVSYQVYDSGVAAGSFSIDGKVAAAHDAATALTIPAASMAGASFVAPAVSGADTIQVRAWDGAYWGDWQALGVLVGSMQKAPVLQISSAGTVVRGGQAIALDSMVSVTAADAMPTTYTVFDPAYGGHVELNGAVNLLDASTSPYMASTYKVSAADFHKLTYVGGDFIGGEALSVSANNASAQGSVALPLQIQTNAPVVQGISHYVAPGSKVAVSDLFVLAGVDKSAIVSYSIYVNHVDGNGTIALNGAHNLLDGTGSPAGNYMVAAADIGKLTYTAGSNTGADFVQIWATDGASSKSGLPLVWSVTGAAQINARPATVLQNVTLPFTKLFSTDADLASLYFYIIDPQGAGAIQLNGANNMLGADATPGTYRIWGLDLPKLAYVGGNGHENLLISTSTDQLHWSPETAVTVTGTELVVTGVRLDFLPNVQMMGPFLHS